MRNQKTLGLGIVAVVLAACASSGRGQTLDQKIANAWTFAARQVLNTASLPSLTLSGGDVAYPTSTGQGSYAAWGTTYAINQESGWDAPFFPGEMWLLYNQTGNATFQTDAEKWTYPLQYTLDGADEYKGLVPTDDAGFQTTVTWGNGMLYSTDPNYDSSSLSSLETQVKNAAYLDSRFVPDAGGTGLIRSLGTPGDYSDVVWPTYPGFSSSYILANHINNGTEIDHLMGLQSMFQAHVLDPTGKYANTSQIYQDAITDAVTSAYDYVRSDGSTYHGVWHYDDSDPNVAQRGQLFCKGTIQGYSNESTWSRGQAWGMYGFTIAYQYTRTDATQVSNGHVSLFLTTAQNMANYFFNNLPANLPHNDVNYVAGDYVPPSDFNAADGEPAVGTVSGAVGGDGAGAAAGANGKNWYDAADTGDFNQNVSGTGSTRGNYVNDRFTGLGTYTGRDTAAAAVGASALLLLAQDDPSATLRLQYFNEASDILNSLLTESSTTGNGETDYFAENTSGQALSVGLLLKESDDWDSQYSTAIFGDYYLLQAMTQYGQLESQFVPEPASLSLLVLALGLLVRPRRHSAGCNYN